MVGGSRRPREGRAPERGHGRSWPIRGDDRRRCSSRQRRDRPTAGRQRVGNGCADRARPGVRTAGVRPGPTPRPNARPRVDGRGFVRRRRRRAIRVDVPARAVGDRGRRARRAGRKGAAAPRHRRGRAGVARSRARPHRRRSRRGAGRDVAVAAVDSHTARRPRHPVRLRRARPVPRARDRSRHPDDVDARVAPRTPPAISTRGSRCDGSASSAARQRRS